MDEIAYDKALPGQWCGTPSLIRMYERQDAVDRGALPCPACGLLTENTIRVAGHEQCPHCRTVIESCCSGESISISAESSSPPKTS